MLIAILVVIGVDLIVVLAGALIARRRRLRGQEGAFAPGISDRPLLRGPHPEKEHA